MRQSTGLSGLRFSVLSFLALAAAVLAVPRTAQAVPAFPCINAGNPDPLEICAKDDSTPGVWLKQLNNPRTRQYFGDYSWASILWLSGTDTAKRYSSEHAGESPSSRRCRTP